MRTLGVAAAVTLAVGGCSGDAPPQPPSATAQCQAAEVQTIQSGLHLVGDQEPPVPYSSTPPTSGWHSGGAPPSGVATEPLSEPEQVTALEVGHIVITHRDLAPGQYSALLDAVSPLAESVVVTPYDKIAPGEVVLAAWGVLQRCDGVDRDAIEAFVDVYAHDSATHTEA